MKVLKEGKWNVPWTGTVTCPTCEAELLIEESDVKPTANAYKYYCLCAICGKTIMIDDKDMPLRLKETVDKKRYWNSSD